ncbi:MAG: radical SAM protein [Candidatus Micrarchaeota archaeon]|nr:radical SAM protein [Candidatus Micrarchaeota archaeon]
MVGFELNTKSVTQGTYTINAPLIKPSKLTAKENGGIGKELSDGWAINYAMGCMHGCRFCYVDGIWKRYGEQRIGKAAQLPWGNYFFVPKNIEQAIEDTEWGKWKGQEAMMCSTHDPYLPQLLPVTRKILEKALPEGVKFCIQTRSPLATRDFDLIKDYKDQVRVQVSIATMNHDLSTLIESRVSPPESRFRVLDKAKSIGLNTGIIIAPIFPKITIRPDPISDLEQIIKRLLKIKPDYIYGESLHTRGSNMIEIEKALGERPNLEGFDVEIGKAFYKLLKKYKLEGRWWPD